MKNIDQLNEHIINISSGLLFAFLGSVLLLDIKTQTESFLVIATIVALLLTVLVNIWYSFRLNLRKKLFNEKIKQFADKSFRSSLEHVSKIGEYDGAEKVRSFFRDHSELIKNKSKEEVSFFLDLYLDKKEDKSKEQRANFIETVAQGLMIQINEIRQQAFFEPLKETFSKVKWILDRISFSIRLYVFVAAMFLFLISSVVLWIV